MKPKKQKKLDVEFDDDTDDSDDDALEIFRWSHSYGSRTDRIQVIFRIRILSSVSDPVFFPDADQTFFSESGSAKNPDPIRKNQDSWKKRPKTRVTVEKHNIFHI